MKHIFKFLLLMLALCAGIVSLSAQGGLQGQVYDYEQRWLCDSASATTGQFSPDPDQVIQRATQTYNASTLAKIDEVMKANEKLIGSSSYDERLNLIESLYSIINSDGRVHEEEMNSLRAVRSGLEQFVAPAPSL